MSCYYQIEYIYTKDFPGRAVPLVILSNGKPGYVINQWIYWLIKRGMPVNSLQSHINRVMQIYEYHAIKYRNKALTKNQAENLLADFLNSKIIGDSDMNWSPNPKRATLRGYVDTITKFDEWHSTFHSAERLNPSEIRFMTNIEIYFDFQRRTKWDAMLHLFPSRSHKKKERKIEVTPSHSRFKLANRKIPKAFPVDRFIDLVECTSNPRDQMLWLLMGGGGLRQSELLNLFYDDNRGIDSEGCTRIRLADPEDGEYTWLQNGELISGSRTQFLAEQHCNEKFKRTRPELYKLKPRTLGVKGRDHSGWKGMTFSDGGVTEVEVGGRISNINEMFWIDQRMGIRFQQAFEEYANNNFYGKSSKWPYHPWMFITVEKGKNFGMPMQLRALNRAWKRALSRINMDNCGLGPHSLRHMYGYYAASILKLPIETTKVLMHHASVTSTEVYYHLSNTAVRKELEKAHADNSTLNSIILPEARKPFLSWSI